MRFFSGILYAPPNYFSDKVIFFIIVIHISEGEVQPKIFLMHYNHKCLLNLEDQSNETYTNSLKASGFAC